MTDPTQTQELAMYMHALLATMAGLVDLADIDAFDTNITLMANGEDVAIQSLAEVMQAAKKLADNVLEVDYER